ncbi:UAA transporter family-domain-containing protein [Gymnopilus junonius]|uniref:UAA transporter family-domain-containing protein n=1 Tax=Gymnopilus junonius TaxID=109634 RepID=A0A9P5NAY8_GYMJU|nr:UAA transporter family-domain-containing protein [Gymnopilus junonius]
MISLLSSWLTTLSLIFGGCCSNAITLEQLTLEHPNIGSVLTLFQFLVISLYGLPKFIVWTWLGPRFRPRRVPIVHYFIQVALFYFISLLNNAAFAYRIPMAVHIIFRSGGLIISMLMGWLISKKRYTTTQVLSVLLVTGGVIITTLSTQPSSSKSALTANANPYTYATGIGILTSALLLSGLLGLIQDWTYSKHGRPTLSSGQSVSEGPAPWQESMFYLHFLALPLFIPLLRDLSTQMDEINSTGPRATFSLPIPLPAAGNLTTEFPMNIVPPHSLPHLPIHLFPQSENVSLLSITQPPLNANTLSTGFSHIMLSVSIPHIYLPLLLNTITQLFCVAGVHRLTTRVTALTVTLVLVVRKAVSLIISVIGVSKVGLALLSSLGISLPDGGWFSNVLGVDVDTIFSSVGGAFVGEGASAKKPPQVDNRMMWTGAVLVLLGTVGYTIGHVLGRLGRRIKRKRNRILFWTLNHD